MNCLNVHFGNNSILCTSYISQEFILTDVYFDRTIMSFSIANTVSHPSYCQEPTKQVFKQPSIVTPARASGPQSPIELTNQTKPACERPIKWHSAAVLPRSRLRPVGPSSWITLIELHCAWGGYLPPSLVNFMSNQVPHRKRLSKNIVLCWIKKSLRGLFQFGNSYLPREAPAISFAAK